MGEAPRSREATKEETREALLLAGLAEFAEKGFDAPSLDAICARAGFTRGAFYVHFKDREDFLVAAMQRFLEPLLDAVIASGDEADDLQRTVNRYVGLLGAVAGLAGAPAARPHTRAPDVAESLLGEAAAAGGLVPFRRLLDACGRSPRLKARFAELVGGAIDRVARTARAAQRAGAVGRHADAKSIGTVLVLLALGVITAIDAGIPFDLERARQGALAMLRAEPDPPPAA